MVTFDQFQSLNNFKDFINICEPITPSNVPLEYYKPVLYFFEEKAFLSIENKTKAVNIQYDDGDIVTYVVKYNQIFNTKVYKLTNIPYSKNNNYEHIKEIVVILFEKMPNEVSIFMHDIEVQGTEICKNKYLAEGYENYYYTYDTLLEKIMNHKTSRRWYKKYIPTLSLQHYNILDIQKEKIKQLYDKWASMSPNPHKSTWQKIEKLLNSKNKDLQIFILKYNNEDIGFAIGAISNQYYAQYFMYDLSRNNKYYNATLFFDLLITQYIKNYFNIEKYYIYGYSDKTSQLKQYKEKWCAGKIISYKLTKENIYLLDYFILGDLY